MNVANSLHPTLQWVHAHHKEIECCPLVGTVYALAALFAKLRICQQQDENRHAFVRDHHFEAIQKRTACQLVGIAIPFVGSIVACTLHKFETVSDVPSLLPVVISNAPLRELKKSAEPVITPQEIDQLKASQKCDDDPLCPPGYIFARNGAFQSPQDQEYYVYATQKVVWMLQGKIQQAVLEQRELTEFFQHLLQWAGEARHRIANHSSYEKSWEQCLYFGRFRHVIQSDAVLEDCNMHTPLTSDRYGVYGGQAKNWIHQCIEKVHASKQRECRIVERGSCAETTSSVHISVYPLQRYKKVLHGFTDPQRRDYIRQQIFKPLLDETDFDASRAPVLRKIDELYAYRKRSFEDYALLKMFEQRRRYSQSVCSLGDPNFEASVKTFIRLTRYCRVGTQELALSHYGISVKGADFYNTPLHSPPLTSEVSLIHQDNFLIPLMLEDLAVLFKKIVEWDTKDVAKLKRNMALFQYKFAHATPFYRGSSAVSEWFELALYRYHGYVWKYSPDKLVNLEALTLSLDAFVRNYDSMGTLTHYSG